MICENLKDIASMVNGKLNDKKYENIVIKGVSHDSRNCKKDSIFFPIRGENFDGHNFIKKAFENGCIASISDKSDILIDNNPIIYVKDSQKALGHLANNYIQKYDIKTVGITGTNGKTSTKDILYSILKNDFKTKKTIGNFNNQIGLPLTVLDFDKDTQIGVLEMGTGSFGEIENLSNIANPSIAVITNVGDTHFDLLLNKEGVAKEKLHIVDNLKKDGLFLLNNDDKTIVNEFKKINFKGKFVTFGQNEDSDFVIKIKELNDKCSKFLLNDKSYEINLLGTHQIYNATVAIIMAQFFGLSYEKISKYLKNIQDLTAMRNEIIHMDGFDILNDAYKSNPQSLYAALETFNLFKDKKRKIVVIGDMLGLEENGENYHYNIGKELKKNDIDYIFTLGDLAHFCAKGALDGEFSKENVFSFTNKDELFEKLKDYIVKNSLILLKASRSLKLEDIIEKLKTVCIK